MEYETDMTSRPSYIAMGDDRHGFAPYYAFDPVWTHGSGLHCHDFYELHIHFQGAKHYCIDNNVYPTNPNQLMIIPPFVMHGHVSSDLPINYDRAFLYIFPSALRRIGADLMDLDAFFSKSTAHKNYNFQLSEDEAALCRQYIREMSDHMDDTSSLGRFSNRCRLMNFLQIVCRTVHRSVHENQPMIVNKAMQEVLAYIDASYTQPIRLDALARRFGVSVSYLSHEFCKYTGRSVYDYILYRRVLSAKEMINSGVSLSDAAYQSGFCDYSNFLRCFKKMTGMTPNAYRNLVKNDT